MVSIRSPHRSKGRLPLGHRRALGRAGFNPLPSPKQGETNVLDRDDPFSQVSIRSPHRSKGRLGIGVARRRGGLVSIRSPHRSKGRLLRLMIQMATAEGFNPLPSPKQGETSSVCSLMPSQASFQSAPLTEARGDLRSSLVSTRRAEFQSAPLTEARGDTLERLNNDPPCAVSIRSPHRSKGRHVQVFDRVVFLQFQSAPLTEARGDLFRCCRSRRPLGVSIRSPHRSKGRPLGLALNSYMRMFQSAPLTEARGDPQAGAYPLPYCEFQSAPLTEARGDLSGLRRRPAKKL